MSKEKRIIEENNWQLREWLACASFIRKKHTIAYPKYFDEDIENEIREFLSLPKPQRDYFKFPTRKDTMKQNKTRDFILGQEAERLRNKKNLFELWKTILDKRGEMDLETGEPIERLGDIGEARFYAFDEVATIVNHLRIKLEKEPEKKEVNKNEMQKLRTRIG